MQYPTTVRYAETILNPDGLLRSLPGLSSSVPPDFSLGAYGVVFRVAVEGRPCALKCFTRHQPGRAEAYRRIVRTVNRARVTDGGGRYLVPLRWLEDEITVFGDDDTVSEHPVLLMEWVEGMSLTRTISAAALSGDRDALARLGEGFDSLALWLLAQPFAHGDLKPDNIMVRPDGGLVLIDYDGLYLPDMAGERARENGTEGFRHPGRSELAFGKHIDDFSIALISLSLRSLARWPELYGRFCGSAALLFDPALLAVGRCPAYNYLKNTELAAEPLFALLGSGAERLDGLADALAGERAGSAKFDYCGGPGREGIRLVRRQGKYGFVTAEDGEVAECVYDRAREFSEGVAAVCRGGKWGFIDPGGERLTDFVYDDCGDFAEGLAPVCIGGKWGFVDQEFRLLGRPRFDDAWSFSEGRALVRRGSRYGFAGPDGRMAIPARYDFGQGFCEGAACVMAGGLYGYVDRRGRWLIEPMFDYARSKRNGRAYVERDGKGREIEL